MLGRVIHRTFTSISMAALLSLVLATSTLAATWSPRTVVADNAKRGFFESQAWSDLIGLSDATAVVLYRHSSNKIYAKRTTDAGASWGSPVVLAPVAPLAAATGRGSKVDFAFSPNLGSVMYSRSTDSGKSFSSPRRIGSSQYTYNVDVARGCCGRVAVAWGTAHGTRVRISHDGGRTFAPKVFFGGPEEYVGAVGVAITGSTFYLVEDHADAGIQVRRSANGADWSEPVVVSSGFSQGVNYLGIAADGDRVSLAIEGTEDGRSVYVADSGDGGETWSNPTTMGDWTILPSISIDGQVRRLAYAMCTHIEWFDGDYPEYRCVNWRAVYRETLSPPFWWGSSSETVAGHGVTTGLDVVGSPMVLYQQGTSLFVKKRNP